MDQHTRLFNIGPSSPSPPGPPHVAAICAGYAAGVTVLWPHDRAAHAAAQWLLLAAKAINAAGYHVTTMQRHQRALRSSRSRSSALNLVHTFRRRFTAPGDLPCTHSMYIWSLLAFAIDQLTLVSQERP